MSNLLRHRSEGFTIVELMIATSVFAVVLILATVALLQVGRAYYKGTTSSQTQDAARTVLESISQGIQFSASGGSTVAVTPAPTPAPGVISNFCINGKQYTYVLDRQLTDGSASASQSNNVLVISDNPTCSTSPPAGLASFPAGTEQLTPGMRLTKMTITQPVQGIFTITVRVVFGDNDLLNAAHDTCNGGAGSQYCAAAELTTTVQKRLL